MDMTQVISQMGILVFIMVVGFACAKLGVTGPEFNRRLSGVVMNVLLVFTVLYSVMNTDIEMDLAELGLATLSFFVMFIVMSVIGFVTAKLLKPGPEREGLTFFGVTFANTVFLGFPVIEALYGSDGLFIAAISNIPFNLMAYTVGLGAVKGFKGGLSLKKAISPPLVASILAVLLFLSGWEVPEIVKDAFGAMSGATIPMSMLIVGTSLGSVSLRGAAGNWRVAVVVITKLLVAPVIVWLVVRALVTDELLLGVIVILASAPPAMLATIFAIQAGKDEGYASECVFIGTVLSAVSMPFVIWLLL